LLEMKYAPTRIDQIVICEVGDPVLETVREKRAIKVWLPPQTDLQCAQHRLSPYRPEIPA
jgi:hypothetical protein